eukprot:TRINITY_DN14572_c0_g1_i1.p1 TRINITY_DN14572_c0_g1~~TRINITY_DN14572_c0_g1_i1.p1  ORF type:complete len:122 (+),score=18.89 TRINITY_DN14572_c0_g1_i1:196-561(+)
MSPRIDINFPSMQGPDVLSRLPLLRKLNGNPQAIALATSLLEDRIFDEVQQLVVNGKNFSPTPLNEDEKDYIQNIKQFTQSPNISSSTSPSKQMSRESDPNDEKIDTIRLMDAPNIDLRLQ